MMMMIPTGRHAVTKFVEFHESLQLSSSIFVYAFHFYMQYSIQGFKAVTTASLCMPIWLKFQ